MPKEFEPNAQPSEFHDLPRELLEYQPQRARSSLLWSKTVVPNAIVFDGAQPGFVTQRIAYNRHAWMISGVTKTSPEGRAHISLNDLLDLPDCVTLASEDHWGPTMIDPEPTLLATPQGHEPVLATVDLIVEPRNGDVDWRFKDPCTGDIYSANAREYGVEADIFTFAVDGSVVSATVSWVFVAEGALRWRSV